MAAQQPRVLLAYDGSDTSKRVLDRVIRFMSHADIAVVTVARPLYAVAPFGGYADPKDEHAQLLVLEEAREMLAREGIAATTLQPVGDPAEEIVAAARNASTDLIVIGARSLGTIERFVLGSVSTKVMHEAPCDVLVVK